MADHDARTDEAPSPAPSEAAAPETPDASAGGRRPPASVLIPWIVAAMATAVAVYFAVAAAGGDRSADIAAIEETTGRFALALTTWDASDGMGDTRDQLRAAGTETFAADVDELFGGTDDLAQLEEIGASSEGEVQDVLVQSVEDDRAEALAVVVQRVTTELAEGAEVSLRYARVGLRTDGDGWRVDEVELVVDALQQGGGAGGPTTPGQEGEG